MSKSEVNSYFQFLKVRVVATANKGAEPDGAVDGLAVPGVLVLRDFFDFRLASRHGLFGPGDGDGGVGRLVGLGHSFTVLLKIVVAEVRPYILRVVEKVTICGRIVVQHSKSRLS